jgi:hypothetical protein
MDCQTHGNRQLELRLQRAADEQKVQMVTPARTITSSANLLIASWTDFFPKCTMLPAERKPTRKQKPKKPKTITTVPATTVPATTVPATTVPATTVPATTVPVASETKTPDASGQPSQPKNPDTAQLHHKAKSFLNDVRCAAEMFDTITPILAAKDRERMAQLQELISKVKEHVDIKDFPGAIKKMHLLSKTTQSLTRAHSMFRRHSIVLLVSRLDEFIADVLRITFQAHPERLKGNAKSLTYDELIGAKSIEEVFLRFADKEIDRVLRESQDEIISYMDETFKIGIKEHFSDYPSFMEITERRNLFVHSGGMVTHQYLENLKKFKSHSPEAPSLGTHLGVSDEYYSRATRLFLEIGLRIGQGVARRVFPDQLEQADTELILFGYDLLGSENWPLARLVFEFARAIPEKMTSNEANRRIFVVNLAIAYKCGGESRKMSDLLDSMDWSACDSKFVLAEAVLRDQFEKAGRIMAALPPTAIPEHYFRDWPLFRDFRSNPEFTRAFKKLFGKDFILELPSKLSAPVCDTIPPTNPII